MSVNNNEGENLSRIREILFGEELGDIQSKFQLFQSENEKKFEELRKQVQENFDSLTKTINKEKLTFEKEYEEKFVEQRGNNDNLKKEIETLNEFVINKTKKIENALEEKQRADEKRIVVLEEKILGILEKIKSELTDAVTEIKNEKIDADILADVFQQVANKFRNKL